PGPGFLGVDRLLVTSCAFGRIRPDRPPGSGMGFGITYPPSTPNGTLQLPNPQVTALPARKTSDHVLSQVNGRAALANCGQPGPTVTLWQVAMWSPTWLGCARPRFLRSTTRGWYWWSR